MKVFTSLAGLVSALSLVVSPVSARVDSYTSTLLRTAQDVGITLALNPTRCDGSYHGMYSTNRVLTVCYDGVPDDNDHDTVRHEAIHAAQHCAAIKRGYPNTIQPILQGERLQKFIRDSLDERTIMEIISHYPQSHHAVELEAFASAAVYTSEEVAGILKSWCS